MLHSEQKMDGLPRGYFWIVTSSGFLGGGCSLTYSLIWGASEIELHEHHANTKLREGGLHLDTGLGAVASHKALVLEICFHL